MSDYTIPCLKKKMRQSLDTFTKPCALQNTDTEFLIGVQGNSMSFLDYIKTDLPQTKKIYSAVLDILHRSLCEKQIEHYAISLISTISIH